VGFSACFSALSLEQGEGLPVESLFIWAYSNRHTLIARVKGGHRVFCPLVRIEMTQVPFRQGIKQAEHHIALKQLDVRAMGLWNFR
jgi:hypothetical protein